MALIVQKYGGTSVGNVERIEAVADKIIDYKQQGNDLVVVVSAMSGETNRLTELAKQIDPRARGRELDVLHSAAVDGAAEAGFPGPLLHRRSGAHPHR